MLRLLPGTLSILAMHLIIAAAFIGVGLSVRRAFGLRDITLDDVFLAFWMGFAAVILFLILWNFAFPVGGAALASVLLAGAAGLWRSRRPLIQLVRDAPARPPAWAGVAVILAALWVANISLGGMTSWDSALYHMQGVQWARLYPVVPGLANLFGPLGFNNAAFLYDAMLDVGPWQGRANHLANGVFVSVFAAQAIVSGAALIHGPAEERPIRLFPLLLLSATVINLQDDRGAAFTTDVAPGLVIFVLTTRWHALLVQPPRDARETGYGLFAIVALAALAVSLKMNAAVYAAFTVPIAGFLWLRRAGPAADLRRKVLGWSALAAIAFGAAWTARGVTLSGYPLFPSRMLAAPVAWRVPAEHAQAEFDYIVDSGRGTVSNIEVVAGRAGLGSWLPRWISRLREQPYTIPVPLAVTVVSLVMWLRMRRGARAEARSAAGPAWWLLLPLGGALVAWFSVAPEPRYAAPLAWLLASLVASQALLLAGERAGPAAMRRFVAAGLVLGASPLLVTPFVHWRRNGSVDRLARWVIVENVKIPPPGSRLSADAARPVTTDFTTASGVVLKVPDRFCWGAPPPCTPNPAPNLRLRVEGRMDRGFMVDGPWQMLYWPEKWRPEYLPAWRGGSRHARAGLDQAQPR